MKKIAFFSFILFLMGALFLSCEKDDSKIEMESTAEPLTATERSDCGHDPNDCQYVCAGTGMCCCNIIWWYEGYDGPYSEVPTPTFCVAKDICTDDPDCVIRCNSTSWDSNQYDLCPPFYDSPPYPPNSHRPTFLCVSKNTAISVTNPSTNFELHFILDCTDGENQDDDYYIIPEGETMEFGFDQFSCDHGEGC